MGLFPFLNLRKHNEICNEIVHFHFVEILEHDVNDLSAGNYICFKIVVQEGFFCKFTYLFPNDENEKLRGCILGVCFYTFSLKLVKLTWPIPYKRGINY